MAEIRCPMCGKPNPDELDVCQYCEARLKPLTDELSRSQPPIHPGEEPTDIDTGQLEPILPQWLREVRQQARESAEENGEQVSAEEEAGQSEESADLLAGLQSQSEESEDIPDWLTGLRGEAGEISSDETTTEEDDLAALKSMFGGDAPDAQEDEESALPGWISDLGAEKTGQEGADKLSALPPEEITEEPVQAESQPPASDSDLGWTADFEADSAPEAGSTEQEAPFDSELPAWLQGADDTLKDEDESVRPAGMEESTSISGSEETPRAASEGDLPDWLASLGNESAEALPQQDEEQPEAQSTTDWLSSLGEETAPQQETESTSESTADWLASLGEETTETAQEPETPESAAEDNIPDWISQLGQEGSEDIPLQESEATVESGDIPDWTSSSGEESGESSIQEGAQQVGESELPDWLSSLGEQESSATEFGETAQPAEKEETPDWLSSAGEGSTEPEQPAETLGVSETISEEPVDESKDTLAPPFVDDEGKPISAEDVESIFSMDMPDWLSDSEGVAGVGAVTESAGAEGDELRPAELPSWVQAMRPVESVISETDEGPAEEQPVEEHGPLAGLRGVLPAVPGVGPSSKPKAYSIKLQASAEQQANATMLEQMLAEEIHPKPISTQKVVLTQRLLRWAIAVLLLLVVGGTIFGSTQITPMPTSAYLETSAALRYIQSTLPLDAPVLLIFDYEASLAGELEATAAPLVDHMLTLKHPRLSLLSSTPTGPGLAERFMGNTQASHNYQRNQQFINLGYLPGDAAGVLAFSESPVSTKPLTTTGEDAWETPVLQGVDNLSDFAAIILMTNDFETARIWIEQTENARGETGLLVVSSAQSGPMILPYYQSGQVDGLVTGLDGSAPIEQINSGRPGLVRRYWDAYGFGLLTATALIVLGSLWSLFSAWQMRRKGLGEE